MTNHNSPNSRIKPLVRARMAEKGIKHTQALREIRAELDARGITDYEAFQEFKKENKTDD